MAVTVTVVYFGENKPLEVSESEADALASQGALLSRSDAVPEKAPEVRSGRTTPTAAPAAEVTAGPAANAAPTEKE